MSAIVPRLFAIDDALAEHGFPRLTPWWRATLARFYAVGRRQLAILGHEFGDVAGEVLVPPTQLPELTGVAFDLGLVSLRASRPWIQ